MHLAILITNTDDSAFAQARPDDGEKFATLIAEVRPDWQCTPFWVCNGEFPPDISLFDGLLITGSPASVRSGAAWIARLTDLIHDVIARRQPLFGACFGHQLIAQALGAEIVQNPDGWGHGLLPLNRVGHAPWSGTSSGTGSGLSLYGSHIEQVACAPDGAEVLFSAPGLPVGGYRIGSHVFTVQHHPEMTHDFILDLVDHYADHVGPEATARAQSSLTSHADRAAFAEEIARFFELQPQEQ